MASRARGIMAGQEKRPTTQNPRFPLGRMRALVTSQVRSCRVLTWVTHTQAARWMTLNPFFSNLMVTWSLAILVLVDPSDNIYVILRSKLREGNDNRRRMYVLICFIILQYKLLYGTIYFVIIRQKIVSVLNVFITFRQILYIHNYFITYRLKIVYRLFVILFRQKIRNVIIHHIIFREKILRALIHIIILV